MREGLITREQRDRARLEQKQNGTRVGYNLVKLGFVQETEITRMLAGAPVGPEGAREWDYTDDGLEVGLNARWGITPNLTMSAALNPDFSQVEGDAAVTRA